jgi:hypothetical protein
MKFPNTPINIITSITLVWKQQSRNWLISLSTKGVVLFFLLSMVCLLWRWQTLPPAVPLWYSRPWGADQLAHPLWLFALPFMMVFFYCFNVILSALLCREHLIFSQVLYLTSFLTSLLCFIALIQIIFLVT